MTYLLPHRALSAGRLASDTAGVTYSAGTHLRAHRGLSAGRLASEPGGVTLSAETTGLRAHRALLDLDTRV